MKPFFTTIATLGLIALSAGSAGVATGQDVIEPPPDVSAAQHGFSQAVRVAWAASPTASASLYRVHRSATGGGLGTSLGLVSGLEFIDSGVSFNVTYYYRVVATSAGIDSAPSQQASAKPVVPAPVAVAAQDTGEGRSIKVTWERPDPGLVLTFDVYRSTALASAGSRVGSRVSGTEYIDRSVNNGIAYYYRVRSVNTGNVQSGDSGVASASASALEAEKPVLSGGADRAGGVSISWTKPSDADVSAYRVYRSQNENERGDFRIETTSRSFTERDLPRGTAYYYRVQALGANRAVKSESEPRRAVVADAAGQDVLLPVTGLVAQGTGSSGAVKLSWQNPPSNNFSYLRIYRNTVPALGSLVADRVGGSWYEDRSLENGITYYYAVKTVDSAGREGADATLASAFPFARTRGSTPPPPVAKLSVRDLGDGTSLKLAWQNPEPHLYASVSIYRSTDPATQGDLVASGYRGSGFLNTRSVQANQQYYYTVVAVDQNGLQSERNPQVPGIATLSSLDTGFDTDADGLPDAWERVHGFHPHLKDDVLADHDADGLPLFFEYQYGTDPWDADSDQDGHSDGTEALNGYDPLGPGRKALVSDAASVAGSFAYGRARLSSLAEERYQAAELRSALELEFGSGRIPNPRSHWPKLVNAYLYGGYTSSEIAHTLRFGPGLVHPAIPASVWRTADEYARRSSS
ncbi:MAG: fibronectin type III domain-containing protein [Parcubacteria group bacterium]|nr:fibronectin type III domain-containing protein [Parcubacteria group bacterium]